MLKSQIKRMPIRLQEPECCSIFPSAFSALTVWLLLLSYYLLAMYKPLPLTEDIFFVSGKNDFSSSQKLRLKFL